MIKEFVPKSRISMIEIRDFVTKSDNQHNQLSNKLATTTKHSATNVIDTRTDCLIKWLWTIVFLSVRQNLQWSFQTKIPKHFRIYKIKFEMCQCGPIAAIHSSHALWIFSYLPTPPRALKNNLNEYLHIVMKNYWKPRSAPLLLPDVFLELNCAVQI